MKPEKEGSDLVFRRPAVGIEISFSGLMEAYDELVDSEYERILAEGKDDESPVISLADIPEELTESRIGSLKKKLEEYTNRLKEEWGNEVTAFELLSPGSRFKRDVLRVLIEKGEVNTYTMSKALAPFGVSDYIKRFENACAVIHDYVLTGGVQVRGGTGLPSVEA